MKLDPKSGSLVSETGLSGGNRVNLGPAGIENNYGPTNNLRGTACNESGFRPWNYAFQLEETVACGELTFFPGSSFLGSSRHFIRACEYLVTSTRTYPIQRCISIRRCGKIDLFLPFGKVPIFVNIHVKLYSPLCKINKIINARIKVTYNETLREYSRSNGRQIDIFLTSLQSTRLKNIYRL